MRAAEDAKEAMQGIFLSERKIDVHYSLPKEEEEKARCDRTKNQVNRINKNQLRQLIRRIRVLCFTHLRIPTPN